MIMSIWPYLQKVCTFKSVLLRNSRGNSSVLKHWLESVLNVLSQNNLK